MLAKTILWANQVVFCCGLRSAIGCACSESFERVSCAVQGLSLSVIGLGLPGRSYKSTCDWLLFLLDLEVPGKGHIVIRGHC